MAHFSYGSEGKLGPKDCNSSALAQEFHVLEHWIAYLGIRRSNMAPVIMNEAGKVETEMFLDWDTTRAFIHRVPVPWYSHQEYRCQAPDPSTFPPRWSTRQSELPFKYADSEGTHTKAAEGFARAAKNCMVRGQPAYLLRATLPLKQFVDHLSKGDIHVYPEMHTVAFTKKMTKENYPQLELSGTDITEEEGFYILEAVYEQKPHLREQKKRVAEEYDNDWSWHKKARKTMEYQSRPTAADDTNKILESIKDSLDNLQAQWTAQMVNPETDVHGSSDDWRH